MRKVFLATVIILSFLCMGFMQAADAQAATSTPSMKIGIYVLSWNFGEFDAQTIASRFDVSQSWYVTEATNDYTQKMNTVKSLNPNYKALMYYNIECVDSNDPDWQMAKNNGWLLKRTDGSYWTSSQYSSLYIADIGNPNYQTWVAKLIKSHLDNRLYFDGVVADCGMASSALEFSGWSKVNLPINPRTNAPWTDAEAMNAYAGLHTTIKNAIGTKILLVNGIWNGQLFYDRYDWLVDFLSKTPMNGLGSEGCWYQGAANGNQFMTEENWLKSLNFVVWMQDNWLKNHPERMLDTTCGAGPQWPMPVGATNEQMMLYGFSSMMLGIKYPYPQNSIGFSFNGAVPAKMFQLEKSLHDLDMGAPLSDYYIIPSTHVYTRDFELGRVMVNPTSTPYAVALPNTCRTLDGQLVNSVNVQPHTGVILTSATPPTGVVFNDDFESGTLSKWAFSGADRWNGAGCTLALQSQIVHTGSYAVRMTTPGIAQNEAAECVKDVNLPDFHLSFYAKIVSWGRRLGSNLYLAWAHGSNGYQSYLCYASLMQDWSGTYKWRINIRTGQSTDAYYLSAPTTLDNNWHRIELSWKKDAATGFAELFVDSIKVVTTPYVDTSTFGNATHLFAGLAINSGSAGFGLKAEVVIDDVVIARA